jgi:hypothetical protein
MADVEKVWKEGWEEVTLGVFGENGVESGKGFEWGG